MKRYFKYLVIMLLAVFPFVINAEEKPTKIDLSDYNTLNLVETLKDEEMESKFEGYKETDDQVVIYMFRGKGCGYCRAFLEYLNNNAEQYSNVKLVSFESWYDEENSKLLEKIAGFLNEQAGGVPYIIIGDQVFPGYAESYNDGLVAAVTNLAGQAPEERYDVFKEYNKSIKFKLSDVAKATIWNFVFVTIATVIIMLYIKSSTNKVLRALGVETDKEVVKEATIEEPVKKVTKKNATKKPSTKKKAVKKSNAKK